MEKSVKKCLKCQLALTKKIPSLTLPAQTDLPSGVGYLTTKNAAYDAAQQLHAFNKPKSLDPNHLIQTTQSKPLLPKEAAQSELKGTRYQ